MLVLLIVDLQQRIIFKLFKLRFPLLVEILEHLITYLYILAHLCLLDIGPELVLIQDNVLLEQAHLPHQVLIELVLMDLAALRREQLHLLLDDAEYQYLLIFIEHAILTLVKDIHEVTRGLQSQ